MVRINELVDKSTGNLYICYIDDEGGYQLKYSMYDKNKGVYYTISKNEYEKIVGKYGRFLL